MSSERARQKQLQKSRHRRTEVRETASQPDSQTETKIDTDRQTKDKSRLNTPHIFYSSVSLSVSASLIFTCGSCELFQRRTVAIDENMSEFGTQQALEMQ